MEQGGFPRVNKNNKWGYLSKQLGILPKDKPATAASRGSGGSGDDVAAPASAVFWWGVAVKRFYVRWIRQFEGERVSPELKKQLLPSAMQMQQQHHLLPQYEQLQQQLGKEGSSQDFSSGGAQLRAERKAALQQQSAAADLIKLIWRRERLSAKYTAEAVAARMARRQRRQALLATGQLAPATDVSRLTQSLADRRYAPGDFVFALNCLYYLSKPLRGLSIEQVRRASRRHVHPALLYEVSLLLEEAAAACRESLLSLHVPRVQPPDLPLLLGCVYDFAATAKDRAAAAAAPLHPIDLLQPQLLLLPASPWRPANGGGPPGGLGGPLLALHALQLASALSANLLLPAENRLFLAGFSRASLGPLQAAASAAQRSSSSSSSSAFVTLNTEYVTAAEAAQAATSAVEETEGADDLSDVEWADQDEEQEHASE
ncbi:uncharacterized protein LOC34620539, partial [Cyclospora cayetanensis]|uniref:Uncharacterized protein LOC34620539 n=1 Tax=Cyclospora cayetanensis TaxID=88456 RepID=A0A6P6RS33_9EIME